MVAAQSPELSAICAKVETEGYESLSVEEEFQIRAIDAATINCFRNAYDQMNLNTLTYSQWIPYRKLLIGLLDQRPNRDFRERYKYLYPDDFVKDVENGLQN